LECSVIKRDAFPALSPARLPLPARADRGRSIDEPGRGFRQIIPILLYHSVAETPPAWIEPFAVRPAQFAKHLDAIVAAGCQALTVSELVDLCTSGTELPPRPVVITFDDGLADTAEEAVPALAARGLPSTVYVTTRALVGRHDEIHRLRSARMLRWDQLGGLEAAGVEIGAHSETHSHLDVMPLSAAEREIRCSKARLEDTLGHPVRTFAYPRGYHNAQVASLVRQAGFDSACAVINAFSSTDDDRFALARLTVKSHMPLNGLTSWLAGQGAPVSTPHRRPRTRMWSLYRRFSSVNGDGRARC
jgi:peptidoglycan/xylan/chitin deacetylase (PgdA/CDA1 family)